MPSTLAYVGLGGNLAQPARHVANALHRLSAWPGVSALRSSRLYRTRPWGGIDQPGFINAVAELRFDGGPAALLAGMLAIEREAGRTRGDERWGPRLIDLDLLVFGDRCMDAPGLAIPHPRLAQRAFVLVPLAEIARDLVVPGIGPVSSLVGAVDASEVTALDCPD